MAFSLAEFHESQLKYKTLVEEITDGYFVVQDEIVVFANQAFCQMHDHPLNEVLGKKIYHFIAPESRKHIQQVLEFTGWDEGKASHLPKIPHSQIRRRMRENAIQKPDEKKFQPLITFN
jgi:PAS domain-containing protein